MKALNWFYSLMVKVRAQSVGKNLHVNRLSIVSKTTILGNNVNFNGMSIRGKGIVRIGDNFHSGKECIMISQNHNYDHGKSIPYDETVIAKEIVIDDNVWIGDRVIILAGAHIGEGAIIQAGSVVVGDVPFCSIAGGHPAKPFKMRDVEHYNKLKKQGKFF